MSLVGLALSPGQGYFKEFEIGGYRIILGGWKICLKCKFTLKNINKYFKKEKTGVSQLGGGGLYPYGGCTNISGPGAHI